MIKFVTAVLWAFLSVCLPFESFGDSASVPSQFAFRLDEGARKIVFSYQRKEVTYVAQGNTISSVVPFRNAQGQPAIAFLDVLGFSVGSYVKLYVALPKIQPINKEYSANRIKLLSVDSRIYLELLQHDTEDLYYTSDILELNGASVISVSDPLVWAPVVQRYIKCRTTAATSSAVSRYTSYSALAH